MDHDQQQTGGRRPRWTNEEDAFLAEKRREGLSKKEVVAAYRKAYPDRDRPDAGILARIPSMARANAWLNGEQEYEDNAPWRLTPPSVDVMGLGQRTERIYGLIEDLDPAEAVRVLNAVGMLCGLHGNLSPPMKIEVSVGPAEALRRAFPPDDPNLRATSEKGPPSCA